METLPVRIHLIDAGMPLPSYAHEGDAGLDVRSAVETTVEPFERQLIPSGFAIAVPRGYAAYVQPRSGCAFKQGLTLINTPGLIDSTYRGEVKVAVVNLDPRETITLHRGDRIAQLVIVPVPEVALVEVACLDETDRGTGGFGSSGTR